MSFLSFVQPCAYEKEMENGKRAEVMRPLSLIFRIYLIHPSLRLCEFSSFIFLFILSPPFLRLRHFYCAF